MNYLIIKNNTITQICTSVEDLLKYLEVKVTDNGVIEITNDGRQLPTTYNMKEFTKEQVIKDILNTQMKRIEGMLQIGIYNIKRI
jgi:hypothetical protein